RIITIQIGPDNIGDMIGTKGKTIRGIQEQTGAEINVDDTGLVTISAVGEGGERARDMVQALVQEPEVDKIYEGVVKSTTAFGAFIEILPGVEGLLHISELQHGRTERTEDVVKKGDHVRVKLLEVDERGRMRLSRKALMDKPEAAPARPGARAQRSPRRDQHRRGHAGRSGVRPRVSDALAPALLRLFNPRHPRYGQRPLDRRPEAAARESLFPGELRDRLGGEPYTRTVAGGAREARLVRRTTRYPATGNAVQCRCTPGRPRD